MGSMLGLMALGHDLASVRPLSEKPSEFDEVAFEHVRRNFQRLVEFFNELSNMTGQAALHFESSPTQRLTAASVNPASGKS
jgi:hypothetical protein